MPSLRRPRRRRVDAIGSAATVSLAAAALVWHVASCVGFIHAGPPGGARGRGAAEGGLRARVSSTIEKTTEVSAEEQAHMDSLCLTLLQRADSVEELASAGAEVPHHSSVNLAEFGDLLAKIDIRCSSKETQALFDIFDADRRGSIDVSEIRHTVRNSGAIQNLYSSSLQNVGLTLIPAFAIAFAFGIFKGTSSGFDFLTSYVIEDSLSIDNLFVFLLVFKYFKIPPSLQTYCLNIGIYGAVILRGLFITIGLSAIKAFRPLMLVFSAILLYASYRTLAGGSKDDDEEEELPEVVQNVLKMLPTSPNFDGDKLFVQSSSGSWLATPLALCIISVELCDLLFAVDSIPAVFAVTDDPLIVFSSNIAAILGLRSLYQVLAIAAQDMAYLETSVAIVLGFVGVKLGLGVAGIEVGSAESLGFIVFVLGGGVALSLRESRSKATERQALDAGEH